MAEKRLIDVRDAVKLLRGKCVAKYPNSFLMGLLASATEIEQMPTVDAVEVVRCKDCRYGIRCEDGRVICDAHDPYEVNPRGDENYFCADGERKANG